MAAPNTTIIWDDQTTIANLNAPVSDGIDRPVFMTVFSSDKGPEQFQKNISGDTWFKLFGRKHDFFRHGQPLLQAAAIAQAGGLQYAKRIVANDSKLANLSLIARVSKGSKQKTDENGNLLYWDDTNQVEVNDPADGANEPVMVETCQISYRIDNIDFEYPTAVNTLSISGTNDMGEVFNKIIYQQKAKIVTPRKNNDGVSGIEEKQKVNNDGSLLYVDAETGEETTDAISASGIENAPLMDEDAEEYADFLLFTLTDTGRGKSNKKIRITADTATRRPVRYIKYQIQVIEDGKVLETLYFVFDSTITEYPTVNSPVPVNMGIYSIISQNSYFLCSKFYDTEWDAFVKKVSELSGLDEKTVAHCDILFGKDTFDIPLENIIVRKDIDSIDFANPAGTALVNGENPNGAFGDTPNDPTLPWDDKNVNQEYLARTIEVFDGRAADGDDIYDLDNTPIYCIFDANYPEVVKEKICELANWREDLMYFRDIGIAPTNMIDIRDCTKWYTKSKFAATYINSYDVIEPFYRKQVTVTVMYDLVVKWVSHFINGANRPFAGIAYGVTFENSIIPGTLNFKPKRVMKRQDNANTYDQKKFFDDYRLNYIAYYNEVPVMDTEYTSQEQYTQLSWVNNVVLVQNIIREIRRMCPKNRYTFLDGQDLVHYKKDCEAIINKYKSLFKRIEIKYIEDTNYQHNKIFYAAIEVVFRDFIQSEIFKITAVNE